jgi:hypothetical protein
MCSNDSRKIYVFLSGSVLVARTLIQNFHKSLDSAYQTSLLFHLKNNFELFQKTYNLLN